MGCVQSGFCKFSGLFLMPPSAGEGRRLSGTGGRVRAFGQLKVHQQHNGSVERPTDLQQVLQPLLLLTCTVLASPGKPRAHAGCPLLTWHQRALLVCLKVSRKLSLHFAVGCIWGFFCLSSTFLRTSSCWRKFRIADGRNFAVTQTFPTSSWLQVVMALEGTPHLGDEWA